MNNTSHRHSRHRTLNTIGVALGFIIIGIMYLAHNLGWVTTSVFRTVISWQMLLVYIGVFQLFKRNLIGGLILMAVGVYFLLPGFYGMGTYWPVLLIVIGIGILLKLFNKNSTSCWGHKPIGEHTESTTTEDGYVTSNITFGEAKHIVLDPVFGGANLEASFGSIALDLRRTTLEVAETYIKVDCSFGSIEIFVPTHWNVIVQVDNTFGGVEDKRMLAPQIDNEHRLIIQGNVNFGGLYIKS
ncbi:hypothetical protein D0T51_10730 [Parabacteroides sp. 52]|uniref:LiaF transmembrane domain-containing protein n=1 Tax=unclassified Parabacteroides TaxID=2649774 RepID=UPI0013D57340|nr:MULTISPECIES: DUF5668 domain-containing protein [unclassified Parabacteroides]MDH6535159.1 putative membrane protein [Parabacteroides sp. PM5-20]NDV56199.1 hypothetical protein [Parabacteroides sp. 52]